MKKITLISSLIMLVSFFGIAQTPQDNAGGIEALKIAYITKKLNLTPTEAQRFWPVYNNYMEDLKKTRLEHRENRDELGMEERILTIRKKYQGEFQKSLPNDKVNNFFKTEREWGNFLRKELEQRRQQQIKRMPPQRQDKPVP